MGQKIDVLLLLQESNLTKEIFEDNIVLKYLKSFINKEAYSQVWNCNDFCLDTTYSSMDIILSSVVILIEYYASVIQNLAQTVFTRIYNNLFYSKTFLKFMPPARNISLCGKQLRSKKKPESEKRNLL